MTFLELLHVFLLVFWPTDLGIWVILGIFALFHPPLLHADEHVGDVERLLLQLGDDQALGRDLGLAFLGSVEERFSKRTDSKREEERSGDDLENKLHHHKFSHQKSISISIFIQFIARVKGEKYRVSNHG